MLFPGIHNHSTIGLTFGTINNSKINEIEIFVFLRVYKIADNDKIFTLVRFNVLFLLVFCNAFLLFAFSRFILI